jgi:hypothetical protein
MAIFNWFSKKPPQPAPEDADSSGLSHVDATQPITSGEYARGKLPLASPGSAGNRKHERLERREMLYAIVRECMTQAGVLSSSYKFKVLSLDSRGRQYLVMMDLPHEHAGQTGRLAEIEALIARNAKSRHDILVTAVYWRVIEHVTSGLTPSVPVAAPVVATAIAAVAPLPEVAKPAPSPATKPRYEPLQEDEVVAFKKALASAPMAPQGAPGELIHSGRRNPAPPDFVDTEIDEPPSPLSRTQYGDLN